MKLAITTKTKLTTKLISTSFKKLTLNEIDVVTELESETSENHWTKQQLSESISNPNNLSQILIVKSKIVGYIIAMPSVDSADILNLAVHKDFKRKGYGSSLINHLLFELKKRQIKNLFLEVRMGNFAAISLYLSLGFKEVSIRKNYYTKNSNELSIKEDGIIMCLEIST
jgi:ribosomal-protein-alanine N-acetyltransferase